MARVARGPRTGAYGNVPWQVLEQVLHLVEDFHLDSAIELALVEAGAPGEGKIGLRGGGAWEPPEGGGEGGLAMGHL